MTPIKLIDELVKFIQEALKEMELSTKTEGVNSTISVFSGYLPDEVNRNIKKVNEYRSLKKVQVDNELVDISKDLLDHYPYVIARFTGEVDEFEKDDVVSITLIISTYDNDSQNGWRDVMNIATRLKTELKARPMVGSFVLNEKIVVNLFEEQECPFWFGTMDLEFIIPQVQEELPDSAFEF